MISCFRKENQIIARKTGRKPHKALRTAVLNNEVGMAFMVGAALLEGPDDGMLKTDRFILMDLVAGMLELEQRFFRRLQLLEIGGGDGGGSLYIVLSDQKIDRTGNLF